MSQTIIPCHIPNLVHNPGGNLIYTGNLDHYYRCKWNWCEGSGRAFPSRGLTATHYLMWECYEAMIGCKKTDRPDPVEARNLLIAACLLNINRSPKKGLSSSEQLDRTFEALDSLILEEDLESIDSIRKIMRAGVGFSLPRVRMVSPSKAEQIMWDICMSQVFSEYHAEFLYFDVAEELGLTSRQMFDRLPEIMKEIGKFETSYAEHRFASRIPSRLALAQEFFSILNGR